VFSSSFLFVSFIYSLYACHGFILTKSSRATAKKVGEKVKDETVDRFGEGPAAGKSVRCVDVCMLLCVPAKKL
jgi:hypothetical protein